MALTCEAHLRQATERLIAAGVETPARDARLMLRFALAVDGAALALHLPQLLDDDTAQAFDSMIQRRAAREPLSHITGQREFWGRMFRVSGDVLDPRPETECLIAEALHRGPYKKLLDLGTGSGCILLTLLAEWPDATGIGTDLSDAALTIAKQNTADLALTERCTLLQSDWYQNVTGVFDLIVSNPPYIAEHEMPELSPEVLDHEPHMALTPGGDGLAAYEAIAALARRHLSPHGTLMVEIGPTQSLQVSAIFANAGLLVHGIIPDLDQRPRVVIAHA